LDDERMMLPHHPDFPHRQRIWIATTLTCGVLAMVVPGLSGLMRWLAPAIAVWIGALGYFVGWAPLKFHAGIWSSSLPKLMAFLSLGAFYVFSAGTLLNLLAYPFLAAELNAEGITFAHVLLMLSAGVGAAGGAHRVYLQHVVVQQAHAGDVRNARA
jgi:hypothetical protein